MNEHCERRKKMKKSSIDKMIFISLILCSIVILGSCKKDNQIKIAEEFIHLQINCETYKNVNEEQVKEKLMPYFSEDGYESYKENYFLYMYPQLFNQLGAEKIEIKKIKCKEVSKDSKGDKVCIFEVKYNIMTSSKKIEMKDNLSITLNKDGKMTEVIILNTSDTIKKLILDVKIQ